MKKLMIFACVFGMLTFMSCGNQTKKQVSNDTVQVDTVDSLK